MLLAKMVPSVAETGRERGVRRMRREKRRLGLAIMGNGRGVGREEDRGATCLGTVGC